MHPKCLNSLPRLVLLKIIRLLDVQSIIQISQTCSVIRSTVQIDYNLGLNLLNIDDEENIQKKEVLKLAIELKTTQNLRVNNILWNLHKLKLENTVELCVNICEWNEDMITQVRSNMAYIQKVLKEMKNVCTCKLLILNKCKDKILTTEYLDTFLRIMKYSVARTFVLHLHQSVTPNMRGSNALSFPDMTNKLVIIGPCNGLLDKRILIQTFAKDIVAKPIYEICSINKVFGKSSHIPGICVVDIMKILKNYSIENYNSINVADLVYMRECCSYHVAAERFYNALANSDNGIKRHDFHNVWEKIFP